MKPALKADENVSEVASRGYVEQEVANLRQEVAQVLEYLDKRLSILERSAINSRPTG